MPKLRCNYPEARVMPWLGRTIDPDEVVDIPERDAESYLAAGWTPVESVKPKPPRLAAEPETKES